MQPKRVIKKNIKKRNNLQLTLKRESKGNRALVNCHVHIFSFFWETKNSFVSHSNQTTMVLEQTQTYRSKEQNRDPQNKPTLLLSINPWQKRQNYALDKTVSSASGAGKTGCYTCKSEISTFLHTIHKNKLKMVKKLKCKTRHCSTPRKNISETFCDINHSDIFLDQSPKAKEISIKAKVNNRDLIKLKSLLCTAKENHQQN